jgi:hypothetical protein
MVGGCSILGYTKNDKIWQILEIWKVKYFTTLDLQFCQFRPVQNNDYFSLIICILLE